MLTAEWLERRDDDEDSLHHYFDFHNGFISLSGSGYAVLPEIRFRLGEPVY